MSNVTSAILKQKIKPKYNLLDNTKKKTQKNILANIFESNKGIQIPKREIEKQLVLQWSLRYIDDNTKLNKTEILKIAEYVPGDIQRDVRLFYDKFKKYGLEKIQKDKSINNELSYLWKPIDMDKLDNIIYPEARNIFKKDSEINAFLKSKNYKCEICGACKSDDLTLRMAIDHWRAHSIYNIDSKKIAVLLCETCNNIHHNYDASKIALKYKDNLLIVKKWVEKEIEIRSYGFMPNENDLKTQIDIKTIITNYYKDLNPLSNNFWKDLF